MQGHLRPAAVLPAVLALALAGCEASKSSNPLSPSVAGPIAGVNITQPKLLEPTQGFKFKESQQPIKLLIENASSSGVRPLTYLFEVATDNTFTNKVYARSGVPQGDGGRTQVIIEKLDLGRVYYWRARAEDGANTGSYSTASFDVLPRALLNAPTLVRPINGAPTTSRRPELVIGYAERNETIGSVQYQFQVTTDPAFSSVVSHGLVVEGGGNTGFTPSADLAANTLHFWRVRATDFETTSGWSTTQSFRTPAATTPPSPGPGPGPGQPPTPPGSCASSNGPFIAQCIAAKYPERLVAGVSLGQRQDNMAFIRDRMIEAGKCGGMDLGRNLKRGGPELSIDFLVHRTGGQDIGIDIGVDYDNTSSPLHIVWNAVGPGAFYSPIPDVACK